MRSRILERDDTPMPATADAAFEWKRTGAPQVRHSHAFLARLRNLLLDRAPDVLAELLRVGATEIPFTENLPPTLTDTGPRPGDDELVAIACRRTTFEWVLRRLVLAEPGVELRHGVAAVGARSRRGRDPTRDRSRRHRSRSRRRRAWTALVVRRLARRDRRRSPCAEELHESGIVYYSRFYRVRAGTEPPAYVGPTAADLGYLKYAIFLGDNDTFSVTYAIESDDEVLRRRLTDADTFETVARTLVAGRALARRRTLPIRSPTCT